MKLWIKYLGVLGFVMAGFGCSPALKRCEFTQPHMGTQFKLVFYAPNDAAASEAADAVSTRIEQLNGVLSDYDASSEVSKLSKTAGSGQAVKVSDDLWAVIEHSIQVADQTHGAYDITIGPAVQLWRKSRDTNRLPAPDDLKAAVALVDYHKVELDPKAHTVKLLTPGMLLDLGGIGKGYTADQCIKLLHDRGIDRALVAAAGDIAVSDAPPGHAGWRIAVDPFGQLDPVAGPPQLPIKREGNAGLPTTPTQRFLLLHNAGISTSGDVHQHVVIDGRRYSHIIDPKTGLGMTSPTAVTVIGPNAFVTDGLDTPLCLLGANEGTKVADSIPDVAAIFFRIDGQRIETTETSRAGKLQYELPQQRVDPNAATYRDLNRQFEQPVEPSNRLR